MSPERSTRSQNLRAFATQELEQFKSGEIDHLSTTGELSERFGYMPNKGGVIRALRVGQVYEARNETIRAAIDTALQQGQPLPAQLRGRERVAALVTYVQGEIESFGVGALEQVSTLEELAKKFGYSQKGSAGSVVKILKRADLLEERNRTRESIRQEARENERVTPSRDWAWMLGILAIGGQITEGGRIILSSKNDPLIQAFKTNGERLFRTNAHIRPRGTTSVEYSDIEFSNLALAQDIGHLTNRDWPRTIMEKHSWILEDPRYIWSFLEGAFEKRGDVSIKPEARHIMILTTYIEVANFLTELLTRVNVRNPKIVPRREAPEGIRGVGINYLEDVKTIAANIRSFIPEKEEKLDYFRKQPSLRSKPFSNEVLVEEWRRLRAELGRIPSSTDIKKLKTQGQTDFDVRTYMRFGKTFSEVRDTLEQMVTQLEGGK